MIYIFIITLTILILTYIIYKLLFDIKLITAKRKTNLENRYSPKMSRLVTRVTKIKLFFLGLFPIKTIHKYRETYYGEIKDIDDCKLNK